VGKIITKVSTTLIFGKKGKAMSLVWCLGLFTGAGFELGSLAEGLSQPSPECLRFLRDKMN